MERAPEKSTMGREEAGQALCFATLFEQLESWRDWKVPLGRP